MTSVASTDTSPPLEGSFGGQDIDWYAIQNATATGNDLYTNGGTQTTQGALSLTQYYGTCWIEFLADGTDHARMIGLANTTQSGLPWTYDYNYNSFKRAIALGSNGIWEVWENGGLVWNGGAYSDGDAFRVAIESTLSGNDVTLTAKYYRNGVLVYTSATPIPTTDFPFHGKVGLAYGNDPHATDVRMSKPAPVLAAVTAVDPKNSDADPNNDNDVYDAGDVYQLAFTSACSFAPGTTWTKAEVDDCVTFEQTIGADYIGVWQSSTLLHIEVTDTTGHTNQVQPWPDRNFHVRHTRRAFVPFATTVQPWRSPSVKRDFGGQDIVWTGIFGASLNGTDLYLTASQWQGGARSQQAFQRGNLWAEIVADGHDHARQFGLAKPDQTVSGTNFDYSFTLFKNGTWGVYESSHVSSASGSYSDQDMFRIQVIGDDVVYIVRDAEVYRNLGALTGYTDVLHVDSLLGDGTSPHISLVRASLQHTPVAVTDSYSIDEDTTLVQAAPGVLHNDTDEDGNSLTAELLDDVADGQLTLASDGSFTYQPDTDYFGQDSFLYRVSDGSLSSSTTVTITVNPIDDPPVAFADSYTLTEDVLFVQAAPGVLANDQTEIGETLSASLVTPPATGTLNLLADGSFSYTSAQDANGLVTFTYRANDGANNSNNALVTLTITPVNDAPVALSDAYQTREDTQLLIAAPGVLTNDTDVDGPSATAELVTGPASGTLSLAADGALTYDPAPGFYTSVGNEITFTYRTSDSIVYSQNATVTITVNDPPTAADDSYTLVENIPLEATLSVLDNDSDPRDQTLTASTLTQPANGSLSLAADGTFTYTPDPDFYGYDSFQYTATDPYGATATAEATLVVAASFQEGDPPLPLFHTPPTAVPTAADGDRVIVHFLYDADGVAIAPAGLGDLLNSSITPTENSGSWEIDSVGEILALGFGDAPYTILLDALDAASLTTFLSSLQFSNPTDYPEGGIRYVHLTVQSTATTFSYVQPIVVAADNDAPAVRINDPASPFAADAPLADTMPAQQTSDSNQLVFEDRAGTRLFITDPDARDDAIQLTLSASHGTIRIPDEATSVVDPTTNATANVILTGTLDDINVALQQVIYFPSPGYIGTDQLLVAVDDLGSSPGPAQTGNGTIAITVFPNAEDQTVWLYGADDQQIILGGSNVTNGYQLVTTPTCGTLHPPVDNVVEYDAQACAVDNSFTFKVVSGPYESAPATVTIRFFGQDDVSLTTTVSGTSNGSGWYKTAVDVIFDANDADGLQALSAVAESGGSETTDPAGATNASLTYTVDYETDQEIITGTVEPLNLDETPVSSEVGVKVDLNPPVIHYQVR